MDPEMRRILLNISANVEENNELLKKLHRAAVWGRVFRAIYWITILGVAVGAYYFIQPYVEGMASLLNISFGEGLGGNQFLEFFRKFR